MQLFSSWTGSDFLMFYIALLGLCSFAAWWIAAHLRPRGQGGESLDAESLALLAGGRERFADALLADLFVRGAITLAADGKLVAIRPRLPASPAGRILLARTRPMTPGEARQLLVAQAERQKARLRRRGLLLRHEAHARLRWFSVAPFIALLVLGLDRLRWSAALGEPTGLLIALMAVTAVIALFRFLSNDPRTCAGIEAVARARAAGAHLARAPQHDEAPLAVALFGTTVLLGTPWEPVHALCQPAGSGGSKAGGNHAYSVAGEGG
jgi:uncharacterized protein (TIGR04222 family)